MEKIGESSTGVMDVGLRRTGPPGLALVGVVPPLADRSSELPSDRLVSILSNSERFMYFLPYIPKKAHPTTMFGPLLSPIK